MALPSDILRVHVLPFLEWEECLDANAVLENDAKLVQKMATEDIATKMAKETVFKLLDECDRAMTDTKRVRIATRLFVFLQHPMGSILLNHLPYMRAFMGKITEISHERPPIWWKRSPLRKRLKMEMDRVAEIIRTR
jgi:hypothetical protein